MPSARICKIDSSVNLWINVSSSTTASVGVKANADAGFHELHAVIALHPRKAEERGFFAGSRRLTALWCLGAVTWMRMILITIWIT